MPGSILFLYFPGNTALIYACCGGYEDVVKVLLDHGAEIESHNENGHTPLMEAASGGHVNVAKLLLERGACINSHSNEFKESALTLACYKGMFELLDLLEYWTSFRRFNVKLIVELPGLLNVFSGK